MSLRHSQHINTPAAPVGPILSQQAWMAIINCFPISYGRLTKLDKCSVQGLHSMTYVATFTEIGSLCLQIRFPEHPLDEEAIRFANLVLGELTPKVTLISNYVDREERALAYEMTHLPGIPLSQYIWASNYDSMLPVTARSFGSMLGNSCIPRRWQSKEERITANSRVMAALDRALAAADPLLVPYLDHILLLRKTFNERLHDLPLAISNERLGPRNVMVTSDARVSGMVDWENSRQHAIGSDLGTMFWFSTNMLKVSAGEPFQMHPNRAEIEREFWYGFFLSARDCFSLNKAFVESIELAMKICCVLHYWGKRVERIRLFPGLLREQLNYKVRWPVQ